MHALDREVIVSLTVKENLAELESVDIRGVPTCVPESAGHVFMYHLSVYPITPRAVVGSVRALFI